MKNVKEIGYPNTSPNHEQFNYYTVGRNCDEISIIQKNGEMTKVNWFQIIKNGEVIAEIKESVCNIYF